MERPTFRFQATAHLPYPHPARFALAVPCVSCLLTLFPALLPAMGTEELGNRPVTGQKEWPEGTLDAINLPTRVYSRWINGNESFFYQGATADLQATLEKFATIKTSHRRIVFRASRGGTSTFEGKAVASSWELLVPSGIYLGVARGAKLPLVLPTEPTLFVDVGSKSLKLNALKVPAGIEVVGPDDLVKEATAGLKSAKDHAAGASAEALGSVAWAVSDVRELAAALDSKSDYVRVCAAGGLARFGARARAALPGLRRAAASAGEAYRKQHEASVTAVEKGPASPSPEERELGEGTRAVVKRLRPAGR